MNINIIPKQTNGKGIFCTVNGLVYFADQDINTCDVSEQVEETTTGFTANENTIILVDTEDANDFGCNYMWYAYVGFIDGVTITESTGFLGSIPPRQH
jgi:hypothetical protein